jgi:hypothetical protein
MHPRVHRAGRLHLGAIERMEVHADEPGLGRTPDQRLEHRLERGMKVAPEASDRAASRRVTPAQVQKAQIRRARARHGAQATDAYEPRKEEDLQQLGHRVRRPPVWTASLDEPQRRQIERIDKLTDETRRIVRRHEEVSRDLPEQFEDGRHSGITHRRDLTCGPLPDESRVLPL